MKERGLFDEEDRLNVLSKLGDNLETLNKKINNPDASVGVCCSHKVVAVGFNTLCYDAKRRGIKPSARINWELFRPILKKALKKEAKGFGGRPAYDYVMMFKIIILQRLYSAYFRQCR